MTKKCKNIKHKNLSKSDKFKSLESVAVENKKDSDNETDSKKPSEKMALARISTRQRDILKIHCIVQGVSMTQLIDNVLEKYIAENDLTKYGKL